MFIRCGLLLALLTCVRTRTDFRNEFVSLDSDFNKFSLWPSVHNAASMLRMRRESQMPTDAAGPNEGVGNSKQTAVPVEHVAITQSPPPKVEVGSSNNAEETKPDTKILQPEIPKLEANKTEAAPAKQNETPKETPEVTPLPTVTTPKVTVKDNGTNADKATKQWDLSNPGAMKRGIIVFGGFSLLAIAYFVFYRTKSKFSDANNSNGTNDTNQFRYGVLQSEDKRDNLELSRVPLTMDSDDEEDEDLEIFDLEQKKKSLSYVNLQTNDEDIVLSPRERNDRDNLLLDIEDGNSDTLINWSNNGSKSIL